MKQYFNNDVRVIVEDTMCEFTIPLELAIGVRKGDVLFPYMEDKSKWVIDSVNIDKIRGVAIKIKERFINSDDIIIFAKTS